MEKKYILIGGYNFFEIVIYCFLAEIPFSHMYNSVSFAVKDSRIHEIVHCRFFHAYRFTGIFEI